MVQPHNPKIINDRLKQNFITSITQIRLCRCAYALHSCEIMYEKLLRSYVCTYVHIFDGLWLFIGAAVTVKYIFT